MKQALYALLLSLILSLDAAPALRAETPEEKGLAIAMEAAERDAGFSDYVIEAIMIMKNQHGDESTRHFRLKVLEIEGDGDKMLTVFDQPRDLAGTVVLTFSHGLEPDEQWIYLPALKRVKRIASKNKSGPFMGSEFAYEDISSWEVEKFSYRYLRDEVVDGRDCFVIENTPAYAFSGYTRQIQWLDKGIYQPRRVEYYDRKNALLKVLTFNNYQQYLDHYWRADEMIMENRQNGKSTRLSWRNYRFRIGLDDDDFNRSTMMRTR